MYTTTLPFDPYLNHGRGRPGLFAYNKKEVVAVGLGLGFQREVSQVPVRHYGVKVGQSVLPVRGKAELW